uniref:uncharacterized protein isoform X2 n=1 Tax=Myxine glutinosa TaxID=7769 RepID=UPI00358F9E42
MGRTEELSDFQRGTVIGCHLSNKSVRKISALLELPRSTVGAVIVKWKRHGATTAQPRSGRPHKLTERDRRVLKRVSRKNRLSTVATLTTEFQTASGSNVSTKTVRRELHEMGFHGRAAAHKPMKLPQNLLFAGAKADMASSTKQQALEHKLIPEINGKAGEEVLQGLQAAGSGGRQRCLDGSGRLLSTFLPEPTSASLGFDMPEGCHNNFLTLLYRHSQDEFIM